MAAEKMIWQGGTLLAPVPAVLVGCGNGKEFLYNLITVAWAGTVCSEPPMVGIGIRPERYSYGLILATGEFTVNLPSTNMVESVDFCGVRSGRDVDKFKACGLTAVPGSQISAPIVAEAPLSLECKLEKSVELGSHTLFLGRIVAVQAACALIRENGSFDVDHADFAAYAHGHYYSLGEKIGHFGFSIRRKAGAKIRN